MMLTGSWGKKSLIVGGGRRGGGRAGGMGGVIRRGEKEVRRGRERSL